MRPKASCRALFQPPTTPKEAKEDSSCQADNTNYLPIQRWKKPTSLAVVMLLLVSLFAFLFFLTILHLSTYAEARAPENTDQLPSASFGPSTESSQQRTHMHMQSAHIGGGLAI